MIGRVCSCSRDWPLSKEKDVYKKRTRTKTEAGTETKTKMKTNTKKKSEDKDKVRNKKRQGRHEMTRQEDTAKEIKT